MVHGIVGDPNASIPTPQPRWYRKAFGAYGMAVHESSITFISQAALRGGVSRQLGLKKIIRAVRNIRDVQKSDLKFNGETPKLSVDPETYEVRVNDEVISCEPQNELPLAQRYFLF